MKDQIEQFEEWITKAGFLARIKFIDFRGGYFVGYVGLPLPKEPGAPVMDTDEINNLPDLQDFQEITYSAKTVSHWIVGFDNGDMSKNISWKDRNRELSPYEKMIDSKFVSREEMIERCERLASIFANKTINN